MSEFLKMDIFFFIASIATIVLTVLVIIALIYVVKILKDLKYISEKAKIETDKITEDMQNFRQSLKQEGFKIKHALKYITSFFKKDRKGK